MTAATPLHHEIAQTDNRIRELEGEIRNLKAKRVRLKQELALPKN
jgi:uncharacterized protein YdcH (DUF465 family)